MCCCNKNYGITVKKSGSTTPPTIIRSIKQKTIIHAFFLVSSVIFTIADSNYDLETRFYSFLITAVFKLTIK